MANENSKPQAQTILLAKIHDLPGVFISKQPDKAYGGLVTSIQAGGVKEPVILRLREDGEYQLVTGYRRRRASELAKKQDIPALVYDMTPQEAIDYHKRVQKQPGLPVPGKLLEPPVLDRKAEKPDIKGTENPTTDPQKVDKPADPAKDGKAQEATAPKAGEKSATPVAGDKPEKAPAPADPAKGGKAQEATAPKAGEKPTTPAAEDKPKEASAPADPAKDGKAQEATAPKAGEKSATPAAGDKPEKAPTPTDPFKGGKAQEATAPKAGEKPATPTAGDKPKEAPAPADPAKGGRTQETTAPKAGEKPVAPAVGDKPEKASAPADPAKGGKAQETTVPKAGVKPATPTAGDKPKEAAKPIIAVTGPAAKGPAGTAISQVFDERLSPPDEKALKGLPVPKEGESFFITLHPAYLEKSKFNVFSVDQSSENFRELKKSVELVGIKDPVLARLKPEGGLEILSGQRRHLAALALNYPVPTIIQKIDDADAKIIVADGNLHRDKISMYDLSRALRMKMEGMKQKSGRRKKGTFKAEELDSDEKLAQEMGMSVSKLNRMLRLSEATKDVCARVDDGSLHLSTASAISFLKPENQDEVLHLMDLGYKVKNEQVERMKKVDKAGKLDEMTMRDILDDKDIKPKLPPAPPAPTPHQPVQVVDGQTTTLQGGQIIPPSPDVKPGPEQTAGAQPTPDTASPVIPFPGTVTPTAPEAAAQAPTADTPAQPSPAPASGNSQEEKEPFKGAQERPEITKVILTGDRLRKYFPDVSMTPREIEESVYDALEERRQRQIKAQQKDAIFQRGKTPGR